MAEEYQGWTNRETWALHLHLSNDEGLYNLATEWAEGTDEEFETQVKALIDPDEYEAEFGSPQSDGLKMMAREVGSLWRVDFHEVAEAFREDEEDEDEDEDEAR